MSRESAVLVVAGILVEEGRVLLAQRNRSRSFGLLWEFPGGKVEPGESETTALIREFREEIGIEIMPAQAYGAIEYETGEGRRLRVTFLLARRVRGEPQALDVEAVAWLCAAELTRVKIIPANREIVDRVREDLEAGRL